MMPSALYRRYLQMASILSHAVAALGIGAVFYRQGMSRRVLIAGALCSVVPDLDVIGFKFGVPYGDFWGHRGFTHSLLFAALLATLVAVVAFRNSMTGLGSFSLWAYLFLATASHGLLDAMTDGGLGVAFLSPLENSRYFLSWRPIHVSLIGISRFFSARGLYVLQSEIVYIWLPSAVLILLAWLVRRIRAHGLASGMNR